MGPRSVTNLILLQGAAFLAAGLGIWWATGRNIVDFVSWEARDRFVAAVLTAGLISAGAAIAFLFPRLVPWAARKQLDLFEGGRFSPVQILLLSAAAGVGEEALFRGGLQTLAGDHLPAAAAILLCSALFAVVHSKSPGILALIFLIGAVFGIAYEVTGSLLGVMLAHAAYDVCAIAAVQRELARQGVFDDRADAAN